MSAGVREEKERGGNVNPSSNILGEIEKTNIWLSAVGYQPLNDCAAGRKHHTLAIAEASHQVTCKCGDFCLITHLSLFLYILWVCVWAQGCAHRRACAFLPACVLFFLCMFYFLDWSVGALLFSKLVTYFKASNWHDSAPTALKVTCGFIKACIWKSRKKRCQGLDK